MKKPFSLTRQIKARLALRFAARHQELSFRQRMELAKAQKTLAAAFALAS